MDCSRGGSGRAHHDGSRAGTRRRVCRRREAATRASSCSASACTGASVSVGFMGTGTGPTSPPSRTTKATSSTSTTRATRSPSRRRHACGCSTAGTTPAPSSGLLCAPAGADGLFADLGALVNRASSMRVCPASMPSGCDALPPRPAAAGAVPNGSPPSPNARLSARRGGRARRTVRFGRGAGVRVGLADEAGRPIAAARCRSSRARSAPARNGGSRPRVTTGADGRALVAARRRAVAPGPRRVPCHTGDAGRGRRRGPAGRSRRRHAEGPPAPHAWRPDDPPARPAARRAGDAPWQARDLAGARTRPLARLRERPDPSRRALRRALSLLGRRARHFPIRAVARADASYPYATGRSRAVRVHVGW